MLQALGAAAALGPGEADSIHALCRKVHVAGRVATGYAAGWRKSPDSAPIPPGLWPVLVLVLLRLSTLAGDAGDEWHAGIAWKCLNAAFAAVELARRDGIDVAALGRLAEERLAAAAR